MKEALTRIDVPPAYLGHVNGCHWNTDVCRVRRALGTCDCHTCGYHDLGD